MRNYSEEEIKNKTLIEKVYAHVLNPLDSARVDEFIAENYIQHSPLAETGAKGLKRFLDWAKKTSPNAQHEVKRIIVDDSIVVAHVHVIINPGDRGNTVIDIFRIENGKVAEHWDASQEIPATSNNDNGIF